MPPAEVERIENILGEQSWNREKQGFVVAAHTSPAALAQDVWDWASLEN